MGYSLGEGINVQNSWLLGSEWKTVPKYVTIVRVWGSSLTPHADDGGVFRHGHGLIAD